jgi:hypothetical protein
MTHAQMFGVDSYRNKYYYSLQKFVHISIKKNTNKNQPRNILFAKTDVQLQQEDARHVHSTKNCVDIKA